MRRLRLRVSSSSSSFSRTSGRARPTRARSTDGHIRSPLRVLLTAIINTALLFTAVTAADVSAHVLDAAEQAVDSTLDEKVFNHRNMNYLTGHSRSHSSSRSGESCDRNPVWNRSVNEVHYEYGCKEIEEMSSDMTLIANGNVRDVYWAEYLGKKVAVKVLRHPDHYWRMEMHKREILTLDTVRGHPNIVNMLGLCGTTIVTEYCEHTFEPKIHRHGKELPIRRIVSLSLDVAKGMQALHELVGGVYLHMKPLQLLVDDNGHGKLNDFNTVRFMPARAGVPGEFCPTLPDKVKLTPWRSSPEYMAGELVSDKSDIHGLGMIFYSLMKGDSPYETSESFKLALINKTRPEIDPSWHEGFMQIVQAMLSEHPKDRPSARQVVAMLEAVLHELDQRRV